MVIEQALEVVHDGLRSQGWWSEKWDVITSIRRSESSWVVARTRRRYAESGDILDRRIGGFGPVVVTDRGDMIPPEGSVKIDHVDESGVATVAARTLSVSRNDSQSVQGQPMWRVSQPAGLERIIHRSTLRRDPPDADGRRLDPVERAPALPASVHNVPRRPGHKRRLRAQPDAASM